MPNGDGGLGAAGAAADAGMGTNPVGECNSGCGAPAPAGGSAAPAPAAAPAAAPAPARKLVGPVIGAARNEVLVRKPYIPAARVARARVQLTDTDRGSFDGSGTLTVTCPGGGQIDLYDAENGGSLVVSTGGSANFDAAALNTGVTLWAEGVAPSSVPSDVTLELALSPGPTCDVLPPQHITLTSIEVFLDLYQSRTAAGTDPLPLSDADKLDPGRFVHRQDGGRHHGRALLIVRKAQPATWNGNVELRGFDARLRLFSDPDEVPAAGQAAVAVPHPMANGAIPAAGLRFWVEGGTVSGALHDSGYRLGVPGLGRDGDWARVTVVEFSNLHATIQPTPPLTVRGNASSLHRFTVRGTPHCFNEDFTDNRPLVLIQDSVLDTKLVRLDVAIRPAGVPVFWTVQRARQPGTGILLDHNDVVALSPNPLPTVDPVATDTRNVTLKADAVGAFAAFAYVDCNGNSNFEGDDPLGVRIDREPYILMNLVLVQVTLNTDDSRTRSANFRGVTDGANGINVSGGSFTLGPTRASIEMNAQIDLVGGGADGKLGLNRVFAGWVNNEVRAEEIVGTYVDNTVAPPATHHHRSIFVSNGAAATGAHPSGSPAFLPGGPTAPAIRAAPLLDSGRAPAGVGGETATMRSSRIASRTDLAPAMGQRWRVRCLDSPGDSDPANHLGFPAAQLTRSRFRLFFRASLCVWTGSSGSGAAAANRLYSVVREYEWRMRGEWTINPGTGAVAQVAAPRVFLTGAVTHSPAEAVDGGDIEVRGPTALNSLARDCRT